MMESMKDEKPPKRRWFPFSLRTMFVLVTVFCVFLGWLIVQLQWIKNRSDAREWVLNNRGLVVNAGRNFIMTRNDRSVIQSEDGGRTSLKDGRLLNLPLAPLSLRMFGENSTYFIVLGNDGNMPPPPMSDIKAKLSDLQQLFPEAEIVVNPPNTR
jgi:hypothetical protein